MARLDSNSKRKSSRASRLEVINKMDSIIRRIKNYVFRKTKGEKKVTKREIIKAIIRLFPYPWNRIPEAHTLIIKIGKYLMQKK